jgi:hypothetical protein
VKRAAGAFPCGPLSFRAPARKKAAPAPEALAATQDALACTPDELGSELTCAGHFTYSLECYGLRADAACGTDTSPRTCTTYKTCEHEDFGRRRFRLRASVSVRYWYFEGGTWKVRTVFHHFRQTQKIETQITIRQSQVPTFDPNAHFEADRAVQRHWQAMLHPDASDSQWTSSLTGGAAFRTAMRQKVVERLRQEQRGFYGSLADRMEQAGDPLQLQSERLTGTKLLWESYVALGLPLSLEHDEELRALLYGDDAVLSGRDVLNERDAEVEPVMDDLVDVYRLFSMAATPPDHHILSDLDPAVRTRANRLKAILDATVDRQAAAGGPEASAWVDATRLRLRLSAPQPQ